MKNPNAWKHEPLSDQIQRWIDRKLSKHEAVHVSELLTAFAVRHDLADVRTTLEAMSVQPIRWAAVMDGDKVGVICRPARGTATDLHGLDPNQLYPVPVVGGGVLMVSARERAAYDQICAEGDNGHGMVYVGGGEESDE